QQTQSQRGARIGRCEPDLLGKRQQQEKEHTQRETHQGVLNGMHGATDEVLPDEEGQEGQPDEYARVLHRAFRLLVEVNRLHEIDTECAVLQLVGGDIAFHPPAAVRSIQIQYLPGRIEAAVLDVPLDWQETTRKPRAGPIALQLDVRSACKRE